jgi:DNA invertase Pin-like site-specific DNA recombinase
MPAAQYIRMSTEHQRYSPDNQRTAIAAYAALMGFEIVETYIDAGRSGLTLSGRPALKQMLSDALSRTVTYRAILVLDVSRWGRFQDTDQSAHYEYMCREAGVAVHYCNEPFQNEGGTMASIVKHMKRVMAAEYSRELSSKVSRAQRQQARLGFKQGGRPAFGTRRQVVDELGSPRRLLTQGQRKALTTDKVKLIWGPAEEIALVRRIFHLFVVKKMWVCEITAWLNERGHRQAHDVPWKAAAVRTLLTNPLYIGRYRFGRIYSNVGEPYAAAPGEMVDVAVLKPIISAKLFSAAAARIKERASKIHTADELLAGLRKLLAAKGTLSSYLIQRSDSLPCPKTFIHHFGSLSAAYKLIDFEEPTHDQRNLLRYRWTEELLLEALRRIYRERGFVNGRAVSEDPEAPSRSLYSYRFGGLFNAAMLAGIPVDPITLEREAMLVRQRAHHTQKKLPRRKPIQRTVNGDRITNDQLEALLKRLLATHGHLSLLLIDSDPTIPSSSFFRMRLGGLKEAYGRIGYHSSQSEILKAAHARGRQPISTIENG